MIKPKISIVIPVYNTEKYLKRCIDSILCQTLKELEIILVDDGSKEKCALLCDEFAKSDTRIKVIHKENGGPGLARNTGLEAVKGEYIGFVDSDDYIEPTMYEALYNAAVKYDVDLALSGVCYVGGNMFGKEGECVKESFFDGDTLFKGEDMKKLLLGVVGAMPEESKDSRYGVSVWKNIFRADVVRKNNIKFLSERKILSEDTLFMIDYIKSAESAVGIEGAYYCYCRNEDSISKSYNPEHFDRCMNFLAVLEKRIEDTVKREEYKLYLDRLIQGYGRILCSMEIMHARDKKIKFSELRKRLKLICTRKEIAEVLKTYPWHKLPVKQAVFAFAMRYRLYLLQILFVILRDR